MGGGKKKDSKSILEMIEEKLESLGVGMETHIGKGDDNVKVIGIGIGLKDAVRAMGQTPRDHVLMVRVDEETQTSLDAWVETGAVKSRSEAAALFIREGLMLRRSELESLRTALDDVEQAKDRLRKRAAEVFGETSEEDDES